LPAIASYILKVQN